MRHNFTQYFETAKRFDTGLDFIRLTDEAPQSLKDFIRSVHMDNFDCLPNDWIYGIILEAFEALEENEIDDCTVEADDWTSQLIEWLHEPFAVECCDEYQEEFVGYEKSPITTQISGGQWLAKNRIYGLVNLFIEANGGENE